MSPSPNSVPVVTETSVGVPLLQVIPATISEPAEAGFTVKVGAEPLAAELLELSG
jgi:hypothetical protein